MKSSRESIKDFFLRANNLWTNESTLILSSWLEWGVLVLQSSGTLFWTFLGVFTEWPKKILFWMLVVVFVTLQTPTDM